MIEIHLVGYSLGALLVRGYLEQTRPKNFGSVVMIGPPNHGSEIVDALGATLFLIGTHAMTRLPWRRTRLRILNSSGWRAWRRTFPWPA